MSFEADEQGIGNMGDTTMSPSNEATLITVPTFHYDAEAARPASQHTQTAIGDEEQKNVEQAQVINYYFPIEVEVIGTINESSMQLIAEYIYNELTIALQS